VRLIGGSLVDGHAASWHFDAMVIVIALDTSLIFPARSVVGLAWQTNFGLSGACEAGLDALELDWATSWGALDDLLLRAASHRRVVIVTVDCQVRLLSAVLVVSVVDAIDVARVSRQQVGLEVGATARLVEGLLRGVVITLIEVKVTADTAQFSLQRAPWRELNLQLFQFAIDEDLSAKFKELHLQVLAVEFLHLEQFRA